MKSKYETDMSEGSLFPKLLRIAIPLMLSGFLQLAFNAADLMVVGKFAGETCLAAVGSNAALIALIINVLIGICTGTSVIVARYYGAKDEQNLKSTVSTSMLIGLAGGIIFALIGIFLAHPLLKIMGTPEEVIPLAGLYLRIYFAGLPFLELYNFASATLRAVGDTKRPLYFLAIAGVVNVLLNLLFVIVFDMAVAGVAIATVISQAISCILVIITLSKTNSIYRLDLSHLRFSAGAFKQIMRIGLPAGIQASLFSISNVIIQSSINSFGAIAMAGNSAAASIEGFAYTSLDSVNQASIASVSQNMGARRYDRIRKSVIYCLLIELVLGGCFGWGNILFGGTLLKLYTNVPAAIEAGVVRFFYMGFIYFTNGFQHMMGGVLRSHGYSLLPTFITFGGICGIRLIWIFTVFTRVRTLECIYISYPLSWVLTFVTLFILYLALRKRAYAANDRRVAAAKK